MFSMFFVQFVHYVQLRDFKKIETQAPEPFAFACAA
jgi:hypothetical protein